MILQPCLARPGRFLLLFDSNRTGFHETPSITSITSCRFVLFTRVLEVPVCNTLAWPALKPIGIVYLRKVSLRGNSCKHSSHLNSLINECLFKNVKTSSMAKEFSSATYRRSMPLQVCLSVKSFGTIVTSKVSRPRGQESTWSQPVLSQVMLTTEAFEAFGALWLWSICWHRVEPLSLECSPLLHDLEFPSFVVFLTLDPHRILALN